MCITDERCDGQRRPPLGRLARPVGDDRQRHHSECNIASAAAADAAAAAADAAAAAAVCSASSQRLNDLHGLAQPHIIGKDAAAAAGKQAAQPLHANYLMRFEGWNGGDAHLMRMICRIKCIAFNTLTALLLLNMDCVYNSFA